MAYSAWWLFPATALAVAQAQHVVREMADLLEASGVTVEYGIHPVAGRMPGHMNVLLAEADVSYDQLKEMDEINPTFAQCDVAIVNRCQRRGESCGQYRPQQPHRRHADSQRPRIPDGGGHQTQPQPRFRWHPQPIVRRR